MRAIAISIAVLLCALISSADPLQRKTFAAAAPCVPNTLVIVTDDATIGDCAGGGSTDSLCACDDDGLGVSAAGDGGGGGVATDIQIPMEGNYGIVNVLDHGAACDFANNQAESSTTDDAQAIQDAIDLVAGDATLSTVFFPRPCYVKSKILWKRGVYLQANQIGNSLSNLGNNGGLFCADGMNTNCLEVSTGGNDMHWSRLRDFNVFKVGSCNETPANVCANSVGGCACNASTDTIGSGISTNGAYLGDGSGFDNVWVQGFPQFGIEIDEGTIGEVKMDNIVLFANGQAAPTAGTATTGSASTTLVASTPTFTTDAEIKKYVRVLTGTGAGQTRLIIDNDTTTLTVDPSWTVTPLTGATFEIDYGGGILLKTGTNNLDGCKIDTIGGDANAPALIVVAEGSGGTHTGGAPGCEIFNAKSEPGSATYPQENVLRLINSGIEILLSGANHIDQTPGGNAIIYFEGKGGPGHVTYERIGTRESAVAGDVEITLSTMGVDDVLGRQIEVGIGSSGGARTHEGTVNEDIIVHQTATPPFACSAHWSGNRYYDTDLNEFCFCNGTDWIETLPEVAGAAEVCS